ncbi:hypothetical protein R0K18_32455, partial [Pantoea sp. SIMBA_133]
MTAHNGDVLVTSQLGEGSTFTLVFPLGLEKQSVDSKSGELQDSGVLIVEDDESLALLLMEEITGNGFAVRHCRSGEEAIEL